MQKHETQNLMALEQRRSELDNEIFEIRPRVDNLRRQRADMILAKRDGQSVSEGKLSEFDDEISELEGNIGRLEEALRFTREQIAEAEKSGQLAEARSEREQRLTELHKVNAERVKGLKEAEKATEQYIKAIKKVAACGDRIADLSTINGRREISTQPFLERMSEMFGNRVCPALGSPDGGEFGTAKFNRSLMHNSDNWVRDEGRIGAYLIEEEENNA